MSRVMDDWLDFNAATAEAAERLGVRIDEAQSMLREACATGGIRTKGEIDVPKQSLWPRPQIVFDDLPIEPHDVPEPKALDRPLPAIAPEPKAHQAILEKVQEALSRQKLEQDKVNIVVVFVHGDDFRYWLDAKPKPPTAGGKQSRIARLLAEMFPAGVPDRADCPRQPLTAELVKRDPSLSPLDPKTLRTAIEAYNRQLGNASIPNVSQ